MTSRERLIAIMDMLGLDIDRIANLTETNIRQALENIRVGFDDILDF